jgi:predicted GNAT family acetyltransferase
MSESFSDNTAENRFELDVDGTVAFADYRSMRGGLAVIHVEAPVALRGTGAAARLMQHIVDEGKARGVEIIPYCSYATAWMERHKVA